VVGPTEVGALALNRSQHVAKVMPAVEQQRIEVDPLSDIVRGAPHLAITGLAQRVVDVFRPPRVAG
tara:strand:+ start:282 stop:479 length:198 start_codon:yes stop_codon:yes gene_type:complete